MSQLQHDSGEKNFPKVRQKTSFAILFSWFLRVFFQVVVVVESASPSSLSTCQPCCRSGGQRPIWASESHWKPNVTVHLPRVSLLTPPPPNLAPGPRHRQRHRHQRPRPALTHMQQQPGHLWSSGLARHVCMCVCVHVCVCMCVCIERQRKGCCEISLNKTVYTVPA